MAEDELHEALKHVIAPMIESDDGELFLVEDQGSLVRLHLKGRFAGCPGNALVTEQVVLPLIRAVRPGADVEVSSGALLPEGSQRILGKKSSA